MSHTEVVHIAAQHNAWRVYRPGYDLELAFEELGEALDAAARLVPDGTPIRIVLDEPDAEPAAETDLHRSAG
jgi:hypothetical protein